jgi:hypothetical protein
MLSPYNRSEVAVGVNCVPTCIDQCGGGLQSYEKINASGPLGVSHLEPISRLTTYQLCVAAATWGLLPPHLALPPHQLFLLMQTQVHSGPIQLQNGRSHQSRTLHGNHLFRGQ